MRMRKGVIYIFKFNLIDNKLLDELINKFKIKYPQVKENEISVINTFWNDGDNRVYIEHTFEDKKLRLVYLKKNIIYNVFKYR